MQWFGNGASGNGNHFWLVAESGYLYKPGNKDWKTLTGLDDMSWMTQVKTVMEAYADNIDGSFVVER
jgi:trehalose-6-phosphatase